jgi:hypothetical protein
MSALEAKAILKSLQEREPLQRLAPKQVRDAGLSEAIAALPLTDTADADALRSALLLWNDDLDASHTLSQHIHTSTGSLLHGMMHRMEGDYSNSAYWFRLAGSHPSFAEIARAVTTSVGETPYVKGEVWDPYAFNRAVEQAVRGGHSDGVGTLERAQFAELSVVAAYCYQLVFGGTVLD